MAEAAIAASAAICVAVLGALLSFISTRRLQRRQARLERLNAQLRDFYGPLYAIFQANQIAHLRFVDTLRANTVRGGAVGPARSTATRRYDSAATRTLSTSAGAGAAGRGGTRPALVSQRRPRLLRRGRRDRN
jgi:hypothetical protein